MSLLNILESLRIKAGTLKIVFFVYLGLLGILDIFLPRGEGHYFVDKIPAFWTLFTLAGLVKARQGASNCS